MLAVLFKTAGVLCLVVSGGMLGWRRGEKVMRRVHVLEEMVTVLQNVKGNLQYRRDGTADALCAALRARPPRCLQMNAALLRTGVQTEASLTALLSGVRTAHAGELAPQEMELFCSALISLGKYPAAQEAQNLAYAALQLESAAKAAGREAEQLQRLYRTAGFSLGAVAALLLL